MHAYSLVYVKYIDIFKHINTELLRTYKNAKRYDSLIVHCCDLCGKLIYIICHPESRKGREGIERLGRVYTTARSDSCPKDTGYP